MALTNAAQDQNIGYAVVEAVLQECEIENLFNKADIVAWVKQSSCPDEVFDDEELGEWAEENGWTREA